MSPAAIQTTYLVKLQDRRQVAERTMAFQLEKLEGFTFTAGQSIDMTLMNPSETDGEGIGRTFSISRMRRRFMRWILVLVALLGLAAHPAMAAPPMDTGVKESATGQKPSQKKPAAAQPHQGSMAVVPAGEFTMGSSAGDADEQPAHQVYVDAFSMDTHEVTVGQYAAFLQAKGIDSPSGWKTMNQPAHHKRPVANVDWRDAVAYCQWAGKRLPTEAEWEKAARGTDGRIYPWGNDPPTPLHANFEKKDWNNHGVLAPVGTLKNGKSPYGIYDMAGNVWEWVSDWYGQDYYTNSPAQNPTGPASGESKVLRGGSWGSDAQQLRSSLRYFHRSAHRHKDYGFRCVKTL